MQRPLLSPADLTFATVSPFLSFFLSFHFFFWRLIPDMQMVVPAGALSFPLQLRLPGEGRLFITSLPSTSISDHVRVKMINTSRSCLHPVKHAGTLFK